MRISTSGNKSHSVKSQSREESEIVATTIGTYLWLSVTHIFLNGQQTLDFVRKTSEGMTSMLQLKTLGSITFLVVSKPLSRIFWQEDLEYRII